MDDLSRAKELYKAGNLPLASSLLSKVLRSQPQNADAMQLLGTIQFQTGFKRDGQKMVERALRLDPELAEGWNNLGLIYHFSERNDEALDCFARSVDSDSGFSEGWKNLAYIRQLNEEHQEALEALSKAANTAEVHFFRGNSLHKLGRNEEAIAEYDRSLELDPNNRDAWHNRGNAFIAINSPDLAIQSLQEALKGAGQEVHFHTSLAAALMQANRPDDALSLLNTILSWDPSFERAQNLKVLAESRQAALMEAAQAPLDEEDEAMILERGHLARSLQNQGKWREAISSLEGTKDGGLRFISALTLPVLCRSKEEIAEALNHFDASLDQIIDNPILISDPHREIGLTTFHLPYLTESDRPYQEKVARAMLASAPSLNFQASFTPGKGKTRVGVASGLLHNHTISQVFGGLIDNIDREQFDMVYIQAGKDDERSAKFAADSKFHLRLPENLLQAREMIARAELDILFYPEIGMYPLTYYLAFSRLAPVQFTTWGHPYTTGSPAIDYYLSDQHLDREDGQEEYTEKLIKLPSFNTYFEPAPPPTQWSRSEFRLPEDKRIYGCPQMPYKFHPDYDRVLNEILVRDPGSVLVLVEPQRASFKKILIERWAAYPALLERVIWLHLLPHDRFLRLLQLCDVQLAPIQFGAGRSTLDALSVAAPMLTWKGPRLKNRISYAIYEQLGFLDLVVEDEESYVRLAVKTAKDVSFNRHCRDEIAKRFPTLTRSRIAVNEFNSFLSEASTRGFNGFGSPEVV